MALHRGRAAPCDEQGWQRKGAALALDHNLSRPCRRQGSQLRKHDCRYWLLSIALVAIASILPYLPSLHCDFTFDDTSAVRDNPVVQGLLPLEAVLTTDFWGTPMISNRSHKSYRPLTTLTYIANHRLHQNEPWGYHLVNVLLHGLASLLVLQASTLLFTAFAQTAPHRYTRTTTSSAHAFESACGACGYVHAGRGLGAPLMHDGEEGDGDGDDSGAAVGAKSLASAPSTLDTQGRRGCHMTKRRLSPLSKPVSPSVPPSSSHPHLLPLPPPSFVRVASLLSGLLFAMHPIHRYLAHKDGLKASDLFSFLPLFAHPFIHSLIHSLTCVFIHSSNEVWV